MTRRSMTQLLLALLTVVLASGCGTIKARTATEQLLVSDAVDQSIDKIDFQPLAGEDVFLDVQFLRAVRGVGFVNSEYIISSIRQRMIAANCRLMDSAADAKFIAEVRVGALGSDCHEVNYGVPGNQALNQTAALMSGAPIPSLPEISLARTDSCRAAAKISLFAYERESRRPVWESGTAQGVSLSKLTWILGAGPFEKGDIYEKVQGIQAIELPEIYDPSTRGSLLAHLKKPRRIFQRQPSVESPALLASPTLVEADLPVLQPIEPSPEPIGVNDAVALASAEEAIQSDGEAKPEPVVENSHDSETAAQP